MSKPSNDVKAPDFAKQYKEGIKTYLEFLPKELQQELGYRQQYDPQFIQQQLGLQHTYDPALASEQFNALQRRDPQWVALHQSLGDKIQQALNRGYVDPLQQAAYQKYGALAGQGEPTRDKAYQALGKQVTGDTLRGTTADPATMHQMTQAILSRQPSLSYGEAQDMAAAVYTGQRGQALQQQRQQATGQFLQTATPTQQKEQSLAQFYGMAPPEMQAYGLAGTYIQPSNSIVGAENMIGGVQAPRSFGYVNPNAGYQGVQFGLQNYQNMLAQQQAGGGNSGNPWMGALQGAATGAQYGSIGGGYGAIGGALTGAVAGGFGYPQYSTMKLKTDIEKVGEQDGLDIVEFSYVGGHCRYRGVIAEQVQEKFPDAVGTREGYLTVDYGKLGIPFHKKCNKCGVFKDIKEFGTATDTIDRHIGRCKACLAEYMKLWEQTHVVRRREKRSEWKADHPGWFRNWWLKKEYGISLIEFNQLVEKQKGLCAICEESPGKKGLHADHCHKNTLVRGLLCFRCNAALGLFRDNPRLLVNAIDYLTPKLLDEEVS